MSWLSVERVRRDLDATRNPVWKLAQAGCGVHLREREISVTKRGYKRFLKATQRKESNTAKTKMDSCVIYERFRDTLVVFESNQN